VASGIAGAYSLADLAELPKLFRRPAMLQKHQVRALSSIFYTAISFLLGQRRDVQPFAVRQFDQRVGVQQTTAISANRLHPRATNCLAVRVSTNKGIGVVMTLG
jgi:hypothetical protein